MGTHKALDLSSSSDRNWWLLSFLPYCPSKEDIAREYESFCGADTLDLPFNEELVSVEPFCLDDSDFGKIPTVIRDRDPEAKCQPVYTSG